MVVAEASPQLVLLIQVDCLVVQFEFSVVALEAVTVLSDVRLVEEVVGDGSDQVEAAIQDQQLSPRFSWLPFFVARIEIIKALLKSLSEEPADL